MENKSVEALFEAKAFTLNRISTRTSRPFSQVVDRFETLVERLDPNLRQEAVDLGADGLRGRLNGLAAPSGFILLAKIEHKLLEWLGRPGQSIQYAIGNPLVAADITAHDIGVGLYAPFRLGIFQDLATGGTTIMFDDPADLMGSFDHEHVAQVGRELSRKIRTLVSQCL